MLLLDDGSMSISLQVICLERGRFLQKIRVLDASSHRVLQAEVVGAGKLHGNL
jgi:flagella basal body P-ring formation protein FlgA